MEYIFVADTMLKNLHDLKVYKFVAWTLHSKFESVVLKNSNRFYDLLHNANTLHCLNRSVSVER